MTPSSGSYRRQDKCGTHMWYTYIQENTHTHKRKKSFTIPAICYVTLVFFSLVLSTLSKYLGNFHLYIQQVNKFSWSQTELLLLSQIHCHFLTLLLILYCALRKQSLKCQPLSDICSWQIINSLSGSVKSNGCSYTQLFLFSFWKAHFPLVSYFYTGLAWPTL